jgi:homoserine kinase
LGDFVEAKKVSKERRFQLHETVGPYSKELKSHLGDEAANCVEVIADAMWSEYKDEIDFGVQLTLHKYMPVKSGLGSSAASCVATTRALSEMLLPKIAVPRTAKNNFMMRGEREVSGHFYPDNIVPSYWGGFHILDQQWQEKIQVPDFYTVVFLNGQTQEHAPEGQDAFIRDIADTGQKRNELNNFFERLLDSNPGTLSKAHKIDKLLNYLRFQSRNAARLMHSLHAKNIPLFGEIISSQEDNFLFEARDKFTHRETIWKIAQKAGACGCAISGSGPSIFAITESKQQALDIRDAVRAHSQFSRSLWLISSVNNEGSKKISSVEKFLRENSSFHNFWTDV